MAPTFEALEKASQALSGQLGADVFHILNVANEDATDALKDNPAADWNAIAVASIECALSCSDIEQDVIEWFTKQGITF